MKEIVREPVSKSKYGRVVFNNHDLEMHEKNTVFCLASFGFDVETIKPSNIPGSKNPDLLMLGTTWEIKTPTTVNRETIATEFRKAVKQSGGKAIFDIRYTRNIEKVEAYLRDLFVTTRGMRRIMIITDDAVLIDIMK